MAKTKSKKIFLFSLVVVLVVGIFFVYQFIDIIRGLPHPEKITNFQPTQSTKIYDRTGEVLLYEIHGEENRTLIRGEDMPDYAKKATIAIEDQNFYNHSAVDIKAVIRAVFVNIIKADLAQGGSTITQQLARNVFLTLDKNFKRKIRETILAYWIEKNYNKEEILNQYLNQISYGSNAYGIESAAQTFLGKKAKDLTLAESALLAGLIQSPSYYSPWGSHLDELLSRKNYVLEQMKKLSFIDEQQLESAKKEDIKFMPQSIGSIKAPHFVMMIKEYISNKYGDDLVENGGLKVVTTLDWKQQEIAQRVVKEGAQRNKELYKGENSSLVSQDPKTGQILAMVGSADYFNKEIEGNFNVATQGKRQPGSTFKPFAYLAALYKGYTPDTILFDVPTEFSTNKNLCPVIVDFSNKNTACFHPQNFDGLFRGPITFKQGLAQSINVASVKTLYLAGIDNTLDIAQKMGITTLSDRSRYGLSLVLGGGEVKLIDLVNAYSVFSQEGIKHKQSFILKIENNKGETLEEYKDEPVQVIENNYARIINNILSDINLRSGLFHSSLSLTVFEGYDVALKTGTTNDYKDAWVMGYSPFITVGVWAGNNNNKQMQEQGGSILAAVPIWSNFLKEIINQYPSEIFNSPESITSNKPILNGQYTSVLENNGFSSQHIHDILYYLDKNNPNEDYNQPNPGNDSQFENWEVPVLEWAKNNVPNFLTEYNK
ncbi:MAG: PBP1A family penicillin-binding protein [Candidatus Paceibacterota bacterium]|jgi:1A family penicillin-binding protein